MYRKATLSDCEKVYHLICNMERKQLPFDRFYLIYQEQINNRHYYCPSGCLQIHHLQEYMAFPVPRTAAVKSTNSRLSFPL